VITVVIPTYNRGAIVVETVECLFALNPPPDAIIVVDQTKDRNPVLTEWDRQGRIRLIRLDQPSIPHAMNVGLLAAATPVVLYLDDDVEPSSALIAAHARAHGDESIWAVVGQILQPGQEPAHFDPPEDDLEFHFNHDTGRFVANVMAGNLSVKREHAVNVGGFDENYIGVAYRFESDFALRLVAAGGKVWFAPEAGLRHLKLRSGGLRSFGDHRSSPSPAHAAGDYYFAMQHRRPLWRYVVRRLRRNVLTRYHLGHPWAVPTKVIGELRGLLLARKLAAGGRRLIPPAGRRNGAAIDGVPQKTS